MLRATQAKWIIKQSEHAFTIALVVIVFIGATVTSLF